uniref:Uncharacterized protein n=1 Tax=Solanum tuberosum TaxID=4113 RepID=M1DWV7_SOLTU
MDAQSPSKRFTRGIPLHVENSVERPSFSLGLTQDFGEVASSMSKSNVMQEIKSKLKNNPIRLEERSAKSKQFNIKFVEGGHISNENGVPNSFDSEFTLIQYASLLWNYVVQKTKADTTSDREAPERPIRIHKDCDSSEKITIN